MGGIREPPCPFLPMVSVPLSLPFPPLLAGALHSLSAREHANERLYMEVGPAPTRQAVLRRAARANRPPRPPPQHVHQEHRQQLAALDHMRPTAEWRAPPVLALSPADNVRAGEDSQERLQVLEDVPGIASRPMALSLQPAAAPQPYPYAQAAAYAM